MSKAHIVLVVLAASFMPCVCMTAVITEVGSCQTQYNIDCTMHKIYDIKYIIYII